MAARSLSRVFEYFHIGVVVSRHRSLDEDDVGFRDDVHHAEVFHRDALAPHPAGHAHPLEDPRGVGTAADRSRGALTVALAVGPESAAEMVTFDDSLEAPSLRIGGHRDPITDREDGIHP